MTEDKSGGADRPADRGSDRIVELSEERKGIIVMPVQQMMMFDMQKLAPRGPPAPEPTAPTHQPPPPPSTDP